MKEFKVVILGPGGVGKSALTVQFISGKFVERYDPTVEDFYRKEIEVDDDPAILEILDTAGTEQFASMRDLYIKNGQGFIIVYSLTSKQSFQDIKLIREQILRVKGTNRVPIVLAANKCDIVGPQREVGTEEGLCLANEWNIPYVETSAKNSAIVNSLFTEIVKEMNLKSFQSYGNQSRKDKKKKQKAAKAASVKNHHHNNINNNNNGLKIANTNTNTTLFSNTSESYASSLKESAMNASNVYLKKEENFWTCCFFDCCLGRDNAYAKSKCNTSSNNNIMSNDSFNEREKKKKNKICTIL